MSAATLAAFGLSAASMNAADGELETVVVTGSRIPQPNLYSSTPITAVSQDEIKYQGTTSIETMLNSLPSVFAGQTSAASNGASGTATADLRGLGSSRTLVLIDGKRLMPGSPDMPVADLNFIPTPMVERLEVMTGGASTVYGSDAIAGVVNFIMRKDFEGVEFDLQGGIAQHANGNKMMRGILADAGYSAPAGTVWDGENTEMTAIFGANTKDGRGNVTAYFGYRAQRAVTESKRDWSACATAVNYYTMTSYYCGGSGTIPAGRFKIAGASAVKADGSSTSAYSGTDAWNYAPYNYLQRPDTRYMGGAFAHYQVNKYLNLSSSFMFMDDHTVAQIAPSGIFYGTYYSVNCDNPYLAMNSSLQSYMCGSNAGSDTDVSTYIGRRFTEAGGRQDDLRHTDYRLVLEANGEILDGFSYDISGQYSTAIYTENYLNDMSSARIAKALQATKDASGNVVCKSYMDGTDTSCVPVNVFSEDSLTSDMINYLKAPGFKQGHTTETVINANITADLTQFGVKSPWAASGLALNFGTEYRREELVLENDLEFQTGDLTGQGSTQPNVSGGFSVEEGFIEGRLPLVSDKPFARDVTIEFGYRYSSYNVQGNVDSYKYALDWQVIDDIKLRGSYQRAVRAPNVNELFYPNSTALWSGTDPCAGATPGYSEAQCERTGVSAADYGKIEQCSSGQCGGYYGGNKALKPETSDTVTLGFVFTPTFIDGLNVTVDYYRIKVKKLIGTIPESIIISKCANTGDSQWCDLIHRGTNGVLFGSGTGSGYVEATNINTGYLLTEGLDISVNYQFDLEQVGLANYGSVSTSVIGTYQPRYMNQPYDGGHTFNCAGYFGLVCGTPNPKWRHTMRATWESPWDFSVSVAWRYFGRVSFDGNSTDVSLNDGYAYDKIDSHIADYNYFDIAGQWAIAKGVTVSAGINNILDKDPPIVDSANLAISSPSGGNGNTYPGVYDALGRTMFLNLTIKL
ncbi:MAG: TonB-dependent receptor [Rhizomicrobium sp.]